MLHDVVNAGLLAQEIDQARLAVGLEPPVQHPTTDVSIYQQRAIACVRKCERQIG